MRCPCSCGRTSRRTHSSASTFRRFCARGAPSSRALASNCPGRRAHQREVFDRICRCPRDPARRSTARRHGPARERKSLTRSAAAGHVLQGKSDLLSSSGHPRARWQIVLPSIARRLHLRCRTLGVRSGAGPQTRQEPTGVIPAMGKPFWDRVNNKVAAILAEPEHGPSCAQTESSSASPQDRLKISQLWLLRFPPLRTG